MEIYPVEFSDYDEFGVIALFTLEYDACAYALMLNEIGRERSNDKRFLYCKYSAGEPFYLDRPDIENNI